MDDKNLTDAESRMNDHDDKVDNTDTSVLAGNSDITPSRSRKRRGLTGILSDIRELGLVKLIRLINPSASTWILVVLLCALTFFYPSAGFRHTDTATKTPSPGTPVSTSPVTPLPPTTESLSTPMTILESQSTSVVPPLSSLWKDLDTLPGPVPSDSLVNTDAVKVSPQQSGSPTATSGTVSLSPSQVVPQNILPLPFAVPWQNNPALPSREVQETTSTN